MILDHCNRGFRIRNAPVRDNRRLYSVLDEQLGDAAIESVETLDQARLDCPLALQSLLELAVRLLRGQPFALFAPDLRQRTELLVGEHVV